MKDSQTDEENSFFPPRSEEVYLLERRIFVLLTKETNEEMEIKDTHIYMQAARISNRPVGLCCSQDGFRVDRHHHHRLKNWFSFKSQPSFEYFLIMPGMQKQEQSHC